eukprot:TRINITY_DN2438_c0_g2_i2.p1 TRINITY_DN2438_c0_g2~~TRINITY_DN2438_c0_g2_i2.p1  ORF type:complete len:119 (-),score=13.67 TRINITY_DN2438_c0_g2_i2:418-774(-)
MNFRLLDVQYIPPIFQLTIILKTEKDPHKNLKNLSYLRLRTWTGLLASITQLVAILAARELRASFELHNMPQNIWFLLPERQPKLFPQLDHLFLLLLLSEIATQFAFSQLCNCSTRPP